MSDWVVFVGKAIDNGTAWLLETQDGDGAIAVLKDDVRFSGDQTEIRNGAKVWVVQSPKGGGRPASIKIPTDECPSGRTKCIGLVMICCDNQRVIGTGLGFWDDCP